MIVSIFISAKWYVVGVDDRSWFSLRSAKTSASRRGLSVVVLQAIMPTRTLETHIKTNGKWEQANG